MATGSAHARVNLIGEHTDYNGGLVLPTLIPPRTTVTVVPTSGTVISVVTDAAGLEAAASTIDAPVARGDWSDYVVGVADALRRRGAPVGGFDARVRSNVPPGAGLSSSAALMVATARALRDAFSLDVDDREIARAAHDAEYSFVGARVGRMDQLVCSLGHEREALFIDMRDLATRALPLGDLDLEIAVIDSGIRHAHATGGYNTRRSECEQAATLLGVRTLRDVEADADLSLLPAPLASRVRHVMSENDRVLAAVAAIEDGDVRALGEIVDAGHASLRDLFEVSLPAIDAIVSAAQAEPEVWGARLTGGGFGGSVLVLTRRGAAARVAKRVAAASSGRVVVPPS